MKENMNKGKQKQRELDWKFTIMETNLEGRYECRTKRSYELRVEFAGQIEAVSPLGVKFYFDFKFNHTILTDNGGDTATITSNKPDSMNEDEWDDIVYQMEDYICTEYRKNPFERCD